MTQPSSSSCWSRGIALSRTTQKTLCFSPTSHTTRTTASLLSTMRDLTQPQKSSCPGTVLERASPPSLSGCWCPANHSSPWTSREKAVDSESAERSSAHCTMAEGEPSSGDLDIYADMPPLLPPLSELSVCPELPCLPRSQCWESRCGVCMGSTHRPEPSTQSRSSLYAEYIRCVGCARFETE